MDPRGTSTVGAGSPYPGPFSLPEAFFKPVLGVRGERAGALMSELLARLWHKEVCLSAQA